MHDDGSYETHNHRHRAHLGRHLRIVDRSVAPGDAGTAFLATTFTTASDRQGEQVAAAFEADGVLHDVATNIECRERTCRVQIDDTDGKVSARIPSIAVQLGRTLPNISADRIDQGGNRSVMVLYMTANAVSRMSPSARYP